MKKIMIDTKRIKLAKVTYFDTRYNGSAVPSVDAYAFLVNVNGTYVNPFNVAEELPVYDRVPYSNTTRDGDDFGTKIVLANGEVKDGPCYVIEKVNVEDYYDKKQMSLSMLEDCMLRSNNFFIDRMGILERNPVGARVKGYSKRKLMEDKRKLKEFQEFMTECEKDRLNSFSK